MLIQFSFMNYRSFHGETILDLSATKYTEHEGHIISIGNEKLLPAAAVFGANGSGKSNLIAALRYMKECVEHSADTGIRPCSIFQPAGEHKDSFFEVYFIDDSTQKSYRYGFTMSPELDIYDEWLDSKSRTGKEYRPVMFRNDGDWEIPSSSIALKSRIENGMSPKKLLLSQLLAENVQKCMPLKDFFDSLVFLSAADSVELPAGLAEDPGITSYLESFDHSITSVCEEDGKLMICRSSADGTSILPAEEEAEGIRRMLSLYPVLKQIMTSGGVLIADNLDFGLHTLLMRNVIITFLNASTNPAHAQLIFTTHDSWLLSNHIFRRDEIWFTAKNEKNESSLYSLAEFQDEDGVKIRKDENHEKNYMMGKYGAVPELDYLHLFHE